MTEVAAPEAPKPAGAEPVAPAEKPAAQPDTNGTEGTEQQQPQTDEQQQPETPEKRESRSRRRFNRERDRRIAAETELRLVKEAQARQQPAGQQREQGESEADPDAPKRESFESYEEYLRADAAHVAAKATRRVLADAERARGETQAQANRREADAEWGRNIEKAREEIEDFDDVIEEGRDAPCTHVMTLAIKESGPLGPHIAHYLAKHPEEAERIAKLKPSRQAAEIVALESKVKKPAKAPSKAPDPINPVGGKGAAATEPLDTRDPKAAEKLSTSEWIKRDAERMRKAGIRP